MMRVMWIDKDSFPKCLTLDKNMQNMKDVLTTSSTKQCSGGTLLYQQIKIEENSNRIYATLVTITI